jgi:hypothetical protein
MATKKHNRDYKAEYKRRIERGLAKGRTLSQARGHPKAGEKHISKPQPIEDHAFQISLQALRSGKSLSKAAKEIRVSPARLRNQAKEKGIIQKQGQRWVVKKDIPREMLVYSNGKAFPIVIRNFLEASKLGQYMSAVRWFLRTNDPKYLEPFIGQSVQDVRNKIYIFETNPNALYRISASGSETFEQIYRIVI